MAVAAVSRGSVAKELPLVGGVASCVLSGEGSGGDKFSSGGKVSCRPSNKKTGVEDLSSGDKGACRSPGMKSGGIGSS